MKAIAASAMVVIMFITRPSGGIVFAPIRISRLDKNLAGQGMEQSLNALSPSVSLSSASVPLI